GDGHARGDPPAAPARVGGPDGLGRGGPPEAGGGRVLVHLAAGGGRATRRRGPHAALGGGPIRTAGPAQADGPAHHVAGLRPALNPPPRAPGVSPPQGSARWPAPARATACPGPTA